ncbi:hypothetical protein PLICRDRAFT_602087 [Plicaturopsis crispa FD-325 SS-3]|nr:hypothetical protein PLICRDRAFT_602087 [Plicaturopsis crispa FD-325 SS-3]
MANSLSALLSADVPDPSDFPSQEKAPGLRLLDSALRCKICTELLAGPVSLKCGHTFCSVCIRNHLTEKALCPVCTESASVGHLRKNPMLEEAVVAWSSARRYVLELSTRESEGSSEQSRSPEPTTRKKRKRAQNVPSSDEEIECIAGPSKLPNRTRSASEAREAEVPDAHNNLPVSCPLCARQVHFNSINAHMDSGCTPLIPSTARPKSKTSAGASKGKTNARTEWSKIMGPSRTGSSKDQTDLTTAAPLPNVSYAVLKDKAIRDMLVDQGLPVSGDRTAWMARYSRWTTIYNANLDCAPAQRRTLPALRDELKKWEDDSRRHASAKEKNVDPLGGIPKEKEGGRAYDEYQRKHGTQFKALTAAARPQKPRHVPEEAARSLSRQNSDTSDMVVADAVAC